MRPFAILSDSSCNLSGAQMKEYGIDAVLSMHFYVNDKEYDANGDWTSFGAKEYYDTIRGGCTLRSSQVSSVAYEEAFRTFLKEGRDILSLSCSEALSSSVKESVAAKERLQKEFPDAKIYCIDSHNCTYSLAMMLIECAKKRDAGESIESVVEWIDAYKQNFNEVGTVDKLTYLRNAGRVSASAAFFGGMLSVKPIVVYDEVGHNVAVEKVRGRKGSLDRVAEYVKEYGDPDTNNNVCIAHADCLEDAQYVGSKIQEFLPDKKLHFHYGYIEPGVGSSVGPGTIIVGFYGDPKLRSIHNR